jgi:hypothetical protein
MFKTRLALLVLALSLFLFLSGCPQALTVPGEKKPPTDTDIAETGPGSLKIDVLDYSWSYLFGNTHIQVSGTVINNTGHPVQSATLTGTLYDQKGTPIAYGDCYIQPTYLPAGGKASFDFTGLTKRESGLTHTRLVVVTHSNAY